MPNTFIDNRDAWLRMSDIDYVGQFVKAWLAFNAWYRNAYTEGQDRKIINEVKWQSNPVLNTLRPKLDSGSDDAIQFRAELALLHQRLDNYELTGGKGAAKSRIYFRRVFLRENAPTVEKEDRYGIAFEAERVAGRHVRVAVTKKTSGTPLLTLAACSHDLEVLRSLPAFASLSIPQQTVLTRIYCKMTPNWYCDLTTHEQPDAADISCGAYTFKCGRDAMFAGAIEILYQMRCTLFHGELAPTKEAVLCYEPAFRLVRRFLDCVV
jgi:hypothetical protein